MDVGILTYQAWWLLYLLLGLPIKSYHFAYKMIYGLHKISHQKKLLLLPYTEFTASSLDGL